ncbi:pyridoxamine 5'-phosphate oxidase family protein [Fructilactobacillus sp. Tb1]|uniref:pyridoxamine 5'-phosphate oxidase family protein n=1 Tax=Fructilactobacillus sp. Tb1 TaxID=3422304 RepID=UPI003D295502
MKNIEKFNLVLKELPGFLNISTCDKAGRVSGSIISFVQDKVRPNVFYVVTAADNCRANNIRNHPQLAISTWFNPVNGNRFSSNRVTGKVVDELDEIKVLSSERPEIKIMSDDFENKCVLVLTLESAILESFTNKPEIIEF